MTEKQIELALAFYPILVECAPDMTVISYGDLLAWAKAADPGNGAITTATARHVGKPLDLLRDLLVENDMPDLSCLVVNQGTGLPGKAYLDAHDLDRDRAHVQAFDWSKAAAALKQGADRRKQAIAAASRKAAKPLTEKEATDLVKKHWLEHRASMPQAIHSHREQLVRLVLDGRTVEDAFEIVLAPMRKQPDDA